MILRYFIDALFANAPEKSRWMLKLPKVWSNTRRLTISCRARWCKECNKEPRALAASLGRSRKWWNERFWWCRRFGTANRWRLHGARLEWRKARSREMEQRSPSRSSALGGTSQHLHGSSLQNLCRGSSLQGCTSPGNKREEMLKKCGKNLEEISKRMLEEILKHFKEKLIHLRVARRESKAET